MKFTFSQHKDANASTDSKEMFVKQMKDTFKNECHAMKLGERTSTGRYSNLNLNSVSLNTTLCISPPSAPLSPPFPRFLDPLF